MKLLNDVADVANSYMEGSEVKIDKREDVEKVPCAPVDSHFYQLTKKLATCPQVNNASIGNFVYVIHDLHYIMELLFTANNVNN